MMGPMPLASPISEITSFRVSECVISEPVISEPMNTWKPPEIIMEIGPEGSSELLMELVDIFRDDVSRRVAKLREAVAGRDTAQICRQAHSVKGTARQMNVEGMAALCQQIELAAESGSQTHLDGLADQLERSFEDACAAMAAYLASAAGRY
jgi:HPt (histidine-containing phosphotransfer) domain-containing protein